MEETTSARLLRQTLGGETPSRPPCLCPGGMMNMMTAQLMDLAGVYWPEAHQDPAVMAQLAAAAYENGLFDNVGVPFCMTVEAENMGAGVDLGDRYTEPRVTRYAVESVDQWEELHPLDPHQGRANTVLEALSLLHTRCPGAVLMGNLTGPISVASSLVDAARFYKELRKKPENAHKVLDLVTDGLIAFGLAQIEAGAEFITISDPSGTGEILGPKLFAEFALPCLNRLCEALRPRCSGVIIHICGQLQPIYPQLAQLKCSALSADAVVNLAQLRAAIPGMVVMGNVSTFALAAGNAATIRTLCQNSLKQGADILAPACGLGTTTTLESIRLMMEAVRSQEEETHAAH
ncbi:hypothetical protein B5G43_09195 [Flavonifractor sp. An92]|uniref:uroporphyrinogen decarboxylase family protein n=1 Tax=Flavonifractor sp. An92 TaxID=1965666 RepID=UPI000B36CB8A|nr:uroporphyrinogen decarboxylase family protein [Flavonifractor sp. An92]OUN06330.1 hypothetical protein B5G43_09195 [Flavonifractor sp. An92]